MERELGDATILAALEASGARIEGVVVGFLQRTLRITQVRPQEVSEQVLKMYRSNFTYNCTWYHAATRSARARVT